MFGNFFASTLNKVLSGVIVLLALFAGVQTWRLSSAQSALEDKRNELATCEARHAVTRASVGTLEAEIADLNEQAEQRAEAYAEAQELAKEREKELAAARRSSDATIARLRELAGHGGKCAVPDELRELAEGL